MTKRLYLFLIISFLAIQLFADDDNPPAYGIISGSVVDALSKEPMPYVNVVVRNSNDSLLTGGITDANGDFSIRDIPEGNNKVEIQFIGYQTVTTKVDISRENSLHNLSTIPLNESSLMLDEVVVRGELSTVTQKIDRKVINVGKDLTATGTNASELLNNIQSVSVDQQTGEISLRGNENVKVLVDGRPTNVSAAQLLKQIPSSSIRSVELITNPSAKYNPEGMTGIINIVLYKSATLGLNGSVTGGLTYGKNLRYNGALDVNYRKGKVNVFMNYGGNGGKWESSGELVREDPDVVQLTNENGDNWTHLVKVGADFYLNDLNTISIYTTQNLYSGGKFRGDQVDYATMDMEDTETERSLDNENYTGTYNLNYRRDFAREGHNLEFNASYSSTGDHEQGQTDQILNPDDLTSNYLENVHDGTTSTILNLDYTNPLTDNIKLEMGLEARMRHVTNLYETDRHTFLYDDMGMKIPDGAGWFETVPMGNSDFTFDRTIYSAYVNYGQQVGKFGMQVGVRLERYDVDALFSQEGVSEPYKDSRLTPYPSAFFTYALNGKNELQLSYSRRVDRPGINQVNPIRSNWSSPLMVFVGNPELTPQFTNSVELNYNRKFEKGSGSMGVFYRRVNDNIIRYGDNDPLEPTRMIISFVNSDGENRYGFEMSGMYKPVKWWNFNASFDVYQMIMSGYALGQYVEVNSFASNVRMNNTFNVTDKFSLQLFGMYRGKRQTVQWDMPPMYMVSTGASYKVFKDKGTINFRVNDVFNTMRFRVTANNYYPGHAEFKWESRTAYIGYTHNFGQGKNGARKLKQHDDRTLDGGGGF